MEHLIWLVPLLPLAGALVNGFVQPQRRVVSLIGPGVVLVAFLCGIYILMEMLGKPAEQRAWDVTAYQWITVPGLGDRFSLNVPLAFRVDPLSITMVLVVTGVGFLIHVYSTGYMADDPRYARYFCYLNLFTFAMLVLVLANNYVLMFVGWEGVGLCSYLLIGYYFDRVSAAAAGKKAFIINRVGDWGFLLGMLLLFWRFGTLTYYGGPEAMGRPPAPGLFDQIASQVQAGDPLLTAAGLLLLLGATGKSAQLPLYLWLPDAMEGPTPVSALIHAATMVTAGVYMIARSHILYDLAPVALEWVAVVGAATALFAATVALVQNDIKRVLAYSTVSQIGYMFLGVGVGAYAAGMFHLVTHAFFKALLFLGAGSVMHSLAGQLDMRKMGGLSNQMRWTFLTFAVGWWAICGLPPFAGFYSKDAILASAYAHNPVLYWVGLFTAGLTAFYMTRLYTTTFLGEPRIELGDEHHGAADHAPGHGAADDHGHGHGAHGAHPAHTHVHGDGGVHVYESPASMTVPLVVLAALAIIGGVWLNGSFMPQHHTVLGSWLAPSVGEPRPHEAGHGGLSEGMLIGLSILFAVIGVAAAWALHASKSFTRQRWLPAGVNALLESRYGYDGLLHLVFVKVGDFFSQLLWRIVDVGIIDGIVNGVGALIGGIARGLRVVQTGYVRNYALIMLAGAAVVIGVFLWVWE
jgi:NADH-quinone oxidoreductase subunit L